MNRGMSILLVFLGLCAGRLPAGEVRYSLPHEILDWTFIAVVTPVNFLIDANGHVAEEPLISSPYTDREERSATVRGYYLHVESGVFNTLVGLVPTKGGWFTHANYVNVKGFAAGLFASNLLMNLTKNMVGRRRPYYDSATDDPDARKSFPSGHALNAWYNWTYLSLFTWEHLGTMDNRWHVAAKTGLSVGGAAFAAWVSATRVQDNKHFVSDTVVGGLGGSLFALLFYAYQNEWLFPVYRRTETVPVSLECRDDRLALTYCF